MSTPLSVQQRVALALQGFRSRHTPEQRIHLARLVPPHEIQASVSLTPDTRQDSRQVTGVHSRH